MYSLIQELWGHLTSRRKKQFVLLFFLILFASIAEALTLGAVIPFLTILSKPEIILNNQLTRVILDFLQITKLNEIILLTTIVFILSASFAGGIKVLLYWASTKLAFGTGTDLSLVIYEKTLRQPYIVHVNRNSSEIISSLVMKTYSVVQNTILPILVLASSIFIVFVVFTTIVVIEPVISMILLIVFSLSYFAIGYSMKAKLVRNGELIAKKQTELIQTVQESLGGIREIILDANQIEFVEIFKKTEIPLRQSQGKNMFYSTIPRYSIEVVGIISIALLSFYLSYATGSIIPHLPFLGAMALGAQRLLPVLQQGYQSWTFIVAGKEILSDVVELLNQKVKSRVDGNSDTLQFPVEKIILKNIHFQFSQNTKEVLRNINLEIPIGSRIGIIGQTGSGKSTLVDLLMGLLEPVSGEIIIGDQILNSENIHYWQKIIAHVPQSIYLSDSNILKNIAFGVEESKIDYNRVIESAKKAQIFDHIDSLPFKFETKVGERGIQLSGGQRQRIGIARALYKNAKIIIFDEATSALDSETEQGVMDSISKFDRDLTIIIIAHRTSTLKICDKVVELKNGEINNSVVLK